MATGQRLPDNWQPTNGDRDYGHALNLNDQQIDCFAEDMRIWAGANANRQIARKADWSLAFKGWMRREAKKVQCGFGKPIQNGRSLIQAADRLIRQAEQGGFQFGPRPGLPVEARTHPVRLLPKG